MKTMTQPSVLPSSTPTASPLHARSQQPTSPSVLPAPLSAQSNWDDLEYRVTLQADFLLKEQFQTLETSYEPQRSSWETRVRMTQDRRDQLLHEFHEAQRRCEEAEDRLQELEAAFVHQQNDLKRSHEVMMKTVDSFLQQRKRYPPPPDVNAFDHVVSDPHSPPFLKSLAQSILAPNQLDLRSVASAFYRDVGIAPTFQPHPLPPPPPPPPSFATTHHPVTSSTHYSPISGPVPYRNSSYHPPPTVYPQPMDSHPTPPRNDTSLLSTPGHSGQKPPAIAVSTVAPEGSGAPPGNDDSDGEGIDKSTIESWRNPAMTLRHNGTVYTHPPCMEGVPVEKIDSSHPYWEKSWYELEEPIDKAMKEFQTRLDAAMRPDSDVTYPQIISRQVRRGKTILDFLAKAEFSPWQLVGKKYITPLMMKYDTLHRLVSTLEELTKFNLKVSPLDWLRQRLCDLIEEEGSEFSIVHTIKNLYRDPKVSGLRRLAGFRSIGRPTVGEPVKPKRLSTLTAAGLSASKTAPVIGKRKGSVGTAVNSNSSQGFTSINHRRSNHGGGGGGAPESMEDHDTLMTEGGGQQRAVTLPPRKRASVRGNSSRRRTLSPASRQAAEGDETVPKTKVEEEEEGRGVMKPRVEAASAEPMHPIGDGDLEYDGFTDSESACGDELFEDDFRLAQIQTPLWVTNAEVRQYWHVDLVTRKIEHQLLQKLDPPVWGRYNPPVILDLSLDHVLAVYYHPASLLVMITVRPGTMGLRDSDLPPRPTSGGAGVGGSDEAGERGVNVFVRFVRERTMHRFLHLCAKINLNVGRAVSPEALQKRSESINVVAMQQT